MIIFSYKNNSHSAKELSQALGCRLQRQTRSNYTGKYILNWGSSRWPNPVLPHQKLINCPDWVSVAVDKCLSLFQFKDEGVPCVPYTHNMQKAGAWLAAGHTVVARTMLRGHGGAGIIVVTPGEDLPRAPLYTRYIKKKKEFRVNVFRGNVITVSEKRRKRGVEVNPYVRSHKHGWVFCYNDIIEPAGLRELAVKAVEALNLDFGAVDIIWNEKENKLYVLEVNTAPGITGSTIEAYRNAIRTEYPEA